MQKEIKDKRTEVEDDKELKKIEREKQYNKLLVLRPKEEIYNIRFRQWSKSIALIIGTSIGLIAIALFFLFFYKNIPIEYKKPKDTTENCKIQQCIDNAKKVAEHYNWNLEENKSKDLKMGMFEGLKIEHYLSLLNITILIIGGIYAFFQWNSAKKLKRAEFIDKIINQTVFGASMLEPFYDIELKKKWFNRKFFEGKSKFLYGLDKILVYCNFICYLYDKNHIEEDELKIMEYYIDTICRNSDVQAYLWNSYHKHENQSKPYMNVIEYAAKKNIIEGDFFRKYEFASKEIKKKYKDCLEQSAGQKGAKSAK